MNKFKHPSEYFKKKIVLETDRLILRRIDICDISDMYEYSSRESTTKFLLWSPHSSRYATQAVIDNMRRAYKAGDYYELAVVIRETGKMVGTCGITSVDERNHTIEIGYVINPDYWGMGFAAEAAAAMINFSFCELGAKRVEAKYMCGNEGSLGVMKKCGMTFEGIQRAKMLVKGEYRDIGISAIVSEEYFSVVRENLYRKFNNSSLFSGLFARIK